MILAGDVDVGDMIVLPDAAEPVLVKKVRLGQGGFNFTVAPETERVVTLTTQVRLRRRGRDLAR